MRVPLFDLQRALTPLREEELEAVARVLESGRFVLGPEVEALEKELSDWTGAEVVTVASGTDALVLVLRALGLEPGDAVIVPAFTFMATASAVLWCGGLPAFADVDPEDGLLHEEQVQQAYELCLQRGLMPRAVLAVSLYGQRAPEDLATWGRAVGIPVIEDAAQAFGTAVPSHAPCAFGVATFSFYPTKNLPASGEGGAVATRDPQLAERVRRMRNHGMTRRYHHEILGTNSRLHELQAALLRVRLRHFPGWREERLQLAARYRDGLRELPVRLLRAPDGVCWHLFCIRVPQRDAVRRLLAQEGVETGVYYPEILPDQPAVGGRGLRLDAYPGAERLAREILALPFFVGLTEEEQRFVVDALRRAISRVQR